MFEFKFDKKSLHKAIESMRNEWEDNNFVSYGTDSPSLNKEQFDKNCDMMLEHLDRMTTPKFQQWCIDNADRKKNGTFYKGRIVSREICDNCVFITEWHNTWIYDALTVKAISDTQLELTLNSITDTPG